MSFNCRQLCSRQLRFLSTLLGPTYRTPRNLVAFTVVMVSGHSTGRVGKIMDKHNSVWI